jgi:hypothetical protein
MFEKYETFIMGIFCIRQTKNLVVEQKPFLDFGLMAMPNESRELGM